MILAIAQQLFYKSYTLQSSDFLQELGKGQKVKGMNFFSIEL